MDAYFGAIFVPNIVYSAVIAGTLSPILIPILLHADESPTTLSDKVSVVATFGIVVLAAIVVPGLAFASVWLPLLFPGFSPATALMALRLIYIIFPAVVFLGVAGILTAILNAYHRFALAAFAPALSSLTVISAALTTHGQDSIYVVGIATALGFLLQALFLAPAIRSLGIRYRPVFNFRHPAILRLLKVGIPLFMYLAVANVAVILERNLASRLAPGTVSTLSYALRLFTVPSSFLAAPLAIVAYPVFAREAARDKGGELPRQVSAIFRLVLFLFLPATVWIILNALPVTKLLYERGRLLPTDSLAIARVLSFYAPGILPVAIAVVLLRCFFAIEDTLTPLLAELASLGFFVLVAPFLTHRFGIDGLVVTRAITFFMVTSILLSVLWKKYNLLKFNDEFLHFGLRILAATAVMGLISWADWQLLQSRFDSGTGLVRSGILFLLLALSSGTFLGAAHLLKLPEMKQIFAKERDA